MSNESAPNMRTNILDAVCGQCRWNNASESDGTICARSVVHVLATSRDYSGNKYTSYKNIDGLISEYDTKAQACAKVLLDATLRRDTDNFEPIETFSIADVASKLE